jgi:hypothetical protein
MARKRDDSRHCDGQAEKLHGMKGQEARSIALAYRRSTARSSEPAAEGRYASAPFPDRSRAMKGLSKGSLFFCALMSAGSSPAFAEELVDATMPERIYEIARGFGSAELGKDSQGDPRIIGRVDGTKYGVYFYGCAKGRECDDIQFSAGWSGPKVSLEKINEWNRDKRFGKAYIDSDGDPRLEMEVNLDYGVSAKNLEDSFNWWSKALKEFKKIVIEE